MRVSSSHKATEAATAEDSKAKIFTEFFLSLGNYTISPLKNLMFEIDETGNQPMGLIPGAVRAVFLIKVFNQELV